MNRGRIFLIIVLVCLWSIRGTGQVHANKKIDSLFRLSEYFGTNRIDSCKIIGDTLLAIAGKNKDVESFVLASLCYTRYYDRTGDYAKAVESALKGLQALDEAKNSNAALRFKLILQLGICHRLIGLPEIGHEFLKEGWKMNKTNSFNLYDVNLLYTHLGNLYIDFKKYDSVRYYCGLVSDTIPSGYNTNMLSAYYNAVGRVYLLSGNEKEAIRCHQTTISFCNRFNNRFFAASAHQLLGSIYLQKGNIDSAIYYATIANNIANTYNYQRHINSSAQVLVTAYEKLNRTDSVIKYLKAQSKAYELLYGKDKVTQLLEINKEIKLKEKDIALQLEKAAAKSRVALIALFLILAALALSFMLYRNHEKNKTNRLLAAQNKEIDDKNKKLEQTITQLTATQAQLIQSEKMASLGELTAGIAHEIQNPLNFVNNFSQVSGELLKELVDEVDKGNTEEVKAIAGDLIGNLEKINHHGQRAADIVKGMLQHSRISSGTKEPTDINALCDEFLRLAYHGLKATNKSFNAKFETQFDDSIGKVNVMPQEMGRVILNLINNAFYAVSVKASATGDGNYEPTVTVTTKKENGKVMISVADNGNGVPASIKDKIFQPFFTTKPTGQGTGLGLSLSYDIVKAHGGELKVETKEGKGSEFLIQIFAT